VVTGSASVCRCVGASVCRCVLCRRVRGWFVGGSWCARGMPGRRAPGSPQVVCRTARAGLRVTRGQVIAWAVARRIGTLAVGDPRGVLSLPAGRRHNQRTRDWRIGHLISVLEDKAEVAGIGLQLVDERGTSSTCLACRSRVPKPAGRVLACPACQFTGHRDLSAAANIAARFGGGITPVIPAGVTHRRAGAHLPGVASSRRDPRRRAHRRVARGSPGPHRPAPATPRLARKSLATRRGACNSPR
jgi:putative transposase